MNKNLKYLLIFLSLISIIWLYLKSTSPTIVNNLPTPIPVKYELIKSIPTSNSVSTIPDTSVIEFYFSKPVDESSAEVTITPEIPLTFSSDTINKAFYIKATPSWKLGTRYNIQIKIKSKEGESLKNPINYSFTLEQLKDSPLSE